jgi:hypothetical protein
MSPDDEFRRLKDMMRYVRERHRKDGLMLNDPMLEEAVLSLKLVEDLHLAHVKEGLCTLNAAEKASVTEFSGAVHKFMYFLTRMTTRAVNSLSLPCTRSRTHHRKLPANSHLRWN